MSSYFVWVQALYGSQIHGLDHACCNTIIDVVMWSRPFYITSLLQFLHADTGSFMQRVAWHALSAQAGAERYACYKLHYTMLATSHTTLCLLQATLHYACYKQIKRNIVASCVSLAEVRMDCWQVIRAVCCSWWCWGKHSVCVSHSVAAVLNTLTACKPFNV